MSRTARDVDYIHRMQQYVDAGEVAQSATAALQGVQAVDDEASAAAATEALIKASAAVKAIEKKRKDAKEPYQESGRNIDAEFTELKSPIVGAEAALKAQLDTYDTKVRQAREEAQREAQAKQEAEEKARREAEAEVRAKAEAAGKPAPAPPPPPPAPEPPPAPAAPPRVRTTDAGSVSVRKVWRYEVVDPAVIPYQYMQPNLGELKRAVKDGVREIAGVRIYETEERHVRSRR